MSDPFIIALVALGLSVVASLVRMIDWFIHSDPKVIAQTTRWTVTVIAALSVPLLVVLLFKEQWTAAVALGAAMVLIPALLGRRMLRWTAFRPLAADRSAPSPTSSGNGTGQRFVDDPELVRRSVAVLEAYLRRVSRPAGERSVNLPVVNGRAGGGAPRKSNGHAEGSDLDAMSGGGMSEEEALAILGLEPGATKPGIREAHRRIARKVHPDHGGSHHLSIKVNEAKETLLRSAGEVSSAASRKRAPPRRRSRPRPPD